MYSPIPFMITFDVNMDNILLPNFSLTSSTSFPCIVAIIFTPLIFAYSSASLSDSPPISSTAIILGDMARIAINIPSALEQLLITSVLTPKSIVGVPL